MDIILYKCIDEINAFPKTLTEGVTISGTLRGECDMLYPVLTFSGDKGLWWFKEYNYIHIPDFNRYYFVSSLNLTSNASIEVSCSVDVLQSWKDYILETECILSRTEDSLFIDNKIVDNEIVTYPDYDIEIVEALGTDDDTTPFGVLLPNEYSIVMSIGNVGYVKE